MNGHRILALSPVGPLRPEDNSGWALRHEYLDDKDHANGGDEDQMTGADEMSDAPGPDRPAARRLPSETLPGMAAGDLHLSVHLGHRWIAAVAVIGGRTWPVTFDGQTRILSGVLVDPQSGVAAVGAAGLDTAAAQPDAYLPDPMAALHIAAETDTRPATAVSGLLAHVANTASVQAGTAVAALTVTTPQPWGPKSRQRLAQAATAAGLPEPAIVTATAATAAAAERGPGRFVLVCTIGDDYPSIAVLEATDRYTQLAATTVHDPDAPGIHDALSAELRRRLGTTADQPAGPDWRALAEIDRARVALTGNPRAPVLLPEHSGPVVVEVCDLENAARPHIDQLPKALRQVLADADIDLADITASVLVAYDATAPAAQAALADAGLPAPTVVTRPDQIAAGAAQLTTGANGTSAGMTPTAATTRLPRGRLTVASLAAVAVLAVASVGLLLQTVTTADISTIATRVVGVRLPIANLALAAALAATAATAAAQLAPTTWLTPHGMTDTATTGYLLRRSYLAAAAAGLALAGLWGLGAGVGVGYADAGYLRWALTAAVPITVCAVIIAAVSPRIPAAKLADWLAMMRPPIWPIAAAAAGVYLVRAAYTLTFPTDLTGLPGLSAAIGAALLGAATAATATGHLGIRVATSLILVPGYALVVAVTTIGYLTTAYIAALLWWHLTTTVSTLRAAAPDRLLTRWLRGG